jgi:hypothetical protein
MRALYQIVRVKDVRSADKSDVQWGKWQDGKMPSNAFPLSRRRGHSFRLGAAYRWRVVRFEACGARFRLLLAFSLLKQQYPATLALESDQDMSVLASYEFHGTHPGWHLLATCDDVSTVPQGVMIGPWQRRIPRARARHRRLDFCIGNDDTALDVAARFFRLHKATESLPL